MLIADIGDSVQRGANEIGNWVPNLLAAIAILIIGYIVAKVVGALVGRALTSAGFDRVAHKGQAGSLVQRVSAKPSALLGTIAFWAVFLGAISLAVTALGLQALEDLVASVYGYLPNVLAALLIFVVASAIAAGIAGLAARLMGDTSLGKIVATAAPILVMTIATFMILDQLQIARNIVTITYAGLIGAIALGAALAFGLGGRDVASRMLEGAYAKGQENKETFKQDLDKGISRGKAEAEAMKEKHVDDSDSSTTKPFKPVTDGSSASSS
jgi:hypothetical protein